MGLLQAAHDCAWFLGASRRSQLYAGHQNVILMMTTCHLVVGKRCCVVSLGGVVMLVLVLVARVPRRTLSGG